MTTNPFLLRCRSLWFRVASALALACAWGYVPALGQEPSALPEAQASLRDSVEAAVAKVKPALVRILVVEADYHDGRQVKLEASGSGVIISESGHVVTNHHVAGHATRLFCTLSTKEEVEAKLVGTDPLTDIAVIQLANDGTRKYPVAGFGDSTAVKVGDPVLAMGSPRALSQSVTLGIVSNTELVLPSFMRGSMELDGEDVGSMVRWIGHDAPIFGGNSGGPLVTLDGRIVGINEISLSLGGAIPGNLAKAIADELIRTGRVRRSWLGVEVQPLLRESGQTRGVLVSGVVRGGPAEASGLQSGDILVRLAGHEVTVRFAEELPAFNQMVAALPIGEEAEVTVLRGGQEVPLKVRTADREEAYPNQHEFKQWGLTGRDLSFMLAAEMKRDSRNGVLVTSVRPGGPAGEAKPQIAPSDVLVSVEGKPVNSAAELRTVTAAITEGKTEPTPVLVGFERKQGQYVTVVKVGIKELEDPGLEVRKAWLPVETQVLTRDIARGLGQPDLTGFRVTRVYPGSTAEKAGLQVGDLILALDGEALTASAP